MHKGLLLSFWLLVLHRTPLWLVSMLQVPLGAEWFCFTPCSGETGESDNKQPAIAAVCVEYRPGVEKHSPNTICQSVSCGWKCNPSPFNDLHRGAFDARVDLIVVSQQQSLFLWRSGVTMFFSLCVWSWGYSPRTRNGALMACRRLGIKNVARVVSLWPALSDLVVNTVSPLE